MVAVSRRLLLKSAAGVLAAGAVLKSPAVLAQAAPLKLKFGKDLPDTHSVNVRLKEAKRQKGRWRSTCFPTISSAVTPI